MKILLINKFLYPKGGDAISTLATGHLLKKKGHDVLFWGMREPSNPEYPADSYFVSYIDLNKPMNIWQKLNTTARILYSFEAKRKIEEFIKKEKPQIVHLNNFAHQISPSILDVIEKYEIPSVMTIRDYKLVCPSYTMISKGILCERCKHGRYYWCFINKCTKNSYSKSLINVLEMYLHHKILDIYSKIDMFISPSKFLREKVKEMSFKKRIIYLPNFVNLEEFIPQYEFEEKSICYAGRLSFEKGVESLIEAVKELDIKLKIIGEGPLRESLEFRVKGLGLKNVYFLGYKTGDELKNEIRNSMFVVLPSECYENNPRSVLESFASGKPVIGSRIGGIPELVVDNYTGLTFEPKNGEDLREKVFYLTKNPDKVVQMGRNARRFVEENHNPEKYYQELMRIYQMVIKKHK